LQSEKRGGIRKDEKVGRAGDNLTTKKGLRLLCMATYLMLDYHTCDRYKEKGVEDMSESSRTGIKVL